MIQSLRLLLRKSHRPFAVPGICLRRRRSLASADRCHSLRSLHPPPAALPSLPLRALRLVGMTPSGGNGRPCKAFPRHSEGRRGISVFLRTPCHSEGAIATVGIHRPTPSFRDQFANWSWESPGLPPVIPRAFMPVGISRYDLNNIGTLRWLLPGDCRVAALLAMT